MPEGFIERSGLLTLVLEDNLHACDSSPSSSSSATMRVANNWIENCRQDLSATDSRETCEVHGIVIKRMVFYLADSNELDTSTRQINILRLVFSRFKTLSLMKR